MWSGSESRTLRAAPAFFVQPPEARPGGGAWPFKNAAEALAWVQGLAPGPLQLGSGQTLGHGFVRLRWTGKKPARAARGGRKARKG